MLKRYMNFCVILITLFSFYFYQVNAYEYKKEENIEHVNELLVEIYDSKQQYEELAGGYETDTVKIYNANNSSYWWPIGSEATVEVDGKTYAKDTPYSTFVTSEFGYREDPFGGGWQFHSGVDISGNAENGVINVIAVKDGIVVYPTEAGTDTCESSTSLSSCGGGYGNYIIIQHSDGNYSLYAHLHAGTIQVVAGDYVEQGQVIAKMGSSGNSTGPHLHFEIREGANSSSATVDPLNYISSENPRSSLFSTSKLIEFLHSWEGKPPQEGNDYIAFDDGYGNITIGWGVVSKYHSDKFTALGVDVSNLKEGNKISKNIVDQVENQIIQATYDKINNMLSNEQIMLETYQIDALVSRNYNYNISGFVSAYKLYGNTQELYDNYMSTPIKSNGKVSKGLIRRRNAEWTLFHTGEYQNNG